MGMSASQVRLLTLTASIHDVEYQAQAIQNAKLQLATQSDNAYQEYLEELDATTLTIKTVDATVPATFNNLCSVNRLRSANGTEYAIKDSRGRLIVSNDVYEGYKDFSHTGYEGSPYQFALYMLDQSNYFTNNTIQVTQLRNDTESFYNSIKGSRNQDGNLKYQSLVDLHDKLVELITPTGDDPKNYRYENVYNTEKMPEENRAEYNKTLAAYEKALFTSKYEESSTGEKYSGAAFMHSRINNGVAPEDLNQDKFDYYVSIYRQIQAAGDCVSISEFNGLDGDAANNSDWLKAQIESGRFTIDMVKTDSKTGEVTLNGTAPSSDTNVSYTESTSIDSKALKKAEAKYEHSLKEIDKKDKAFDLSLTKLEAKRKALTTEYDSVKKVIEENIDRSYKIFS